MEPDWKTYRCIFDSINEKSLLGITNDTETYKTSLVVDRWTKDGVSFKVNIMVSQDQEPSIFGNKSFRNEVVNSLKEATCDQFAKCINDNRMDVSLRGRLVRVEFVPLSRRIIPALERDGALAITKVSFPQEEPTYARSPEVALERRRVLVTEQRALLNAFNELDGLLKEKRNRLIKVEELTDLYFKIGNLLGLHTTKCGSHVSVHTGVRTGRGIVTIANHSGKELYLSQVKDDLSLFKQLCETKLYGPAQ
jgi:hypothetical protein